MAQVTKTTDEQIEELILSYEVEILAGIEATEGLRGGWGVRLTPGRLQIGLLDDDKRIDRNCIEIYFGYDYLEKKSIWQANIGSRGAFDITPRSERMNFYIGAGLILSSDLVQNRLKQALRDDFMDAYRKIIGTK